MFSIIKKIKFLIFCYYRGHRFGVTKYEAKGEVRTCARCGYRKKQKYKHTNYDDYYIY